MADLYPDQMPEGWSAIADTYERAFEKLTQQFSYKALDLLGLKTGERVLDVAAGTGSFALAAARFGGEVLATDFAPGMIERLRKRIDDEGLSNIQAEVMDGESLEVEDASYDVVASIVGVIFFPDIAKGISELRRVLKPGGRCAIVCWDDPEKFEMMMYLKKAITIAAPGFEMPSQPPTWARMCGVEALKEKMSTAKFKDVRVIEQKGELKIDSIDDFWNDFTCSAPPMAKLFSMLGEHNTKKTGEVLKALLIEDKGESPELHASACIGIGTA